MASSFSIPRTLGFFQQFLVFGSFPKAPAWFQKLTSEQWSSFRIAVIPKSLRGNIYFCLGWRCPTGAVEICYRWLVRMPSKVTFGNVVGWLISQGKQIVRSWIKYLEMFLAIRWRSGFIVTTGILRNLPFRIYLMVLLPLLYWITRNSGRAIYLSRANSTHFEHGTENGEHMRRKTRWEWKLMMSRFFLYFALTFQISNFKDTNKCRWRKKNQRKWYGQILNALKHGVKLVEYKQLILR